MGDFINFSLTEDEVKSLLALNPETSGMIYSQLNPKDDSEFLPNKKIRVFQNPNWSGIELEKQSVIFVKAEENGLIPFNKKDKVYRQILEAIKNGTSVVLLMSNFGFFVVDFQELEYFNEVQENLEVEGIIGLILSAFNEVAQTIGQGIENQELANEMVKLVGLNSLQEIFTSLGVVRVSFAKNPKELIKKLKNVKEFYYSQGDAQLISNIQQ